MGASAPHTSMGRGGLIGTALAGHGTPHIYGAGASMGKRLGVSAPHTSMGRGPLWGSIGGSHRPTPPCTTTKPRPIGTVPPAGPAAPLPAQAPPLPVPAADAPRARRRPAMAAGSAARGAALRGAGGAVRGGSGAAHAQTALRRTAGIGCCACVPALRMRRRARGARRTLRMRSSAEEKAVPGTEVRQNPEVKCTFAARMRSAPEGAASLLRMRVVGENRKWRHSACALARLSRSAHAQ